MRAIFQIALVAIISLSTCRDVGAWRHGYPGFNNGGVQINRTLHAYYMGMNSWLNIWQQGDQINIVSSLNGTLVGADAWNATGASGQAYFNSTTGELNVPVQTDVTSYGRGLFTAPAVVPNTNYGAGGQWWLGAVYNLEWDGTISTAGTKITSSGSFGTGGSPGIGTIGSCGTRCVPVTFGSSTAVSNLALYFVIDASNRADPPRNIRFYPARFQTQVQSADLATKLINPDWLAQWGSIGKIRWMPELGGDLNGNGMTDYSQLAEYTYNTFAGNFMFCGFGTYCTNANWTVPAGTNTNYGPKGSIGPQTVCVVHNKVRAHVHYLFPYGANSTFGTQVAQAFDGCLNQGLVVDYEYCNEIWNFGGAFKCFYYLNSQAWPPLGVSAPYQQATSITSITVGATTTINMASNPYTNGQTVSFNINTGDSIAAIINGNTYTVSSAGASSFVISANTTGTSYSSGGTVYTSGAATTRGGYNSAVLMNQVRNAYGASKRSRWKGVLGSQLANTAVTTAALTGAMFYITNESTGSGTCSPNLCLQDLFDYVEVAPYAGNSAYNGIAIQNITQNTAAGSTIVTAAGHDFTNGQKIRIYAKTGMTQIDNATATVSSANIGAGTFNIDIDTTGYSAWVSHTQSSSTGNGNFAIDNALPKAADDSIALHGSTPGTYPTKYSYFAEQMTDATLNGTSVSNPSFGYTVSDTLNYRSFTSCGTSCIPGQMLAHARLANSYGLTLNEYEGSSFGTYLDTNCTGSCANVTSGGTNSDTLWDFFYNWPYDAGTATHGPADIVNAHITASQAAGTGWPSIFNDEGPTANPFYFTRYFGDSHAQLTAFNIANALGPYVQPRPSKSWTATYAGNGTNRFFSSSACSSCTDTFSGINLGTAASRVFMIVSGTGASGTPTVTCDTQGGGTPVVLTQDATSPTSSGIASIYSGNLSANASATRTCTLAYSGTGQSFEFREYYAFVVTGLQSNIPTFTSATNIQGGNITASSNSMVVVAATRPTFATQIDGYNTPSTSNPATTTVASDYDGATHAAGFALFNPSWISQLMNVTSSNGTGGAQAVGVYNFLLKRDIDPASNDNNPMFLENVA